MIDISLDKILDQIHKKSEADQSAIYYLAYPSFNSLIRSATAGASETIERYWRNYFLEAETIQKIRQSEEPFVFFLTGVGGREEQSVAVPIQIGSNVIGVVVHCYYGNIQKELYELQEEAAKHNQGLFNNWVEFLVAEQTKPLSFLFHMASTISSSLDLDRVLLSVVEQATLLFRAKMSSLMLVERGKRELELVTAYGCSLDYLDKPNLPLDGSILGNVVTKNTMTQIDDVLSEPLYLHKDHAAREGVASLLAAPISFHDDVLGVLNIYSATPRHWLRSEKELLQTFADHAAIAINNVRVHEQIVSMEEQLHVTGKLATLGELAAGMAHEIRNPLAVINMLIHSWVPNEIDPEEFAHDLEVIAHKVSNLNTLVNDLLNLAKSRPLELKPHSIAEVFDQVLRLLRHRIHQQRVQVKKNIVDNTLQVPIDRERLEQAILNLLLNALDVTDKGGTIDIQVQPYEEYVSIDISDSGPGIAEEMLPELFKAFRTSKTTGVGLGLPMTRRIVEEHKGEIFVSRNEADGATFTIRLPLSQQET